MTTEARHVVTKKSRLDKMTDEERQAVMQRIHDTAAEHAKKQAEFDALPAESKRERNIQTQRELVQRHLSTPEQLYHPVLRVPYMQSPFLVLQLAPWSPRGSTCRFWECGHGESINPGEYRFALRPGSISYGFGRASDGEHFDCESTTVKFCSSHCM